MFLLKCSFFTQCALEGGQLISGDEFSICIRPRGPAGDSWAEGCLLHLTTERRSGQRKRWWIIAPGDFLLYTSLKIQVQTGPRVVYATANNNSKSPTVPLKSSVLTPCTQSQHLDLNCPAQHRRKERPAAGERRNSNKICQTHAYKLEILLQSCCAHELPIQILAL